MTRKNFRLLTVLLAAVMVVALSLNVTAAKSNAVTQDGLTAQLVTDKDSYKAGESVKASVQVYNHTGREVFIFAQINVPEGVELASEGTAFDARFEDIPTKFAARMAKLNRPLTPPEFQYVDNLVMSNTHFMVL